MAEPTWWQDAWWHQQPDGTWLRFNDQTQTWEAVPSQPVYAAAPGMSTGAKVAIAAVVALINVRNADGSSGYCMEAIHEQLSNQMWSYDSDIGEPLEGPCF